MGPDRAWMRSVAVVWLAVMVAMMGMSLVMPFLPLYLAELGVPRSEARLWAGWVGGINFLCAALFAPLWGSLADRHGRKLMAMRALVGLAATVGLMGAAQNVYQLFFLRMLQGMLGGFVAEAIALVSTTVPRERLGAALGMVQTAVVSGNFIGPLVGGELSHHFGYRNTFRITSGALLAALLLVAFLVREGERPLESERKGVGDNLRELLALPVLRWTMIVVVLSQSGLMLINPQISLFVQDLSRSAAETNRAAGLVTAAPALSGFLLAPLWGRLGDRKGADAILGGALLGAALVAPWAALAGVWWHIGVVRLLMGGCTAAMNPSTHSVVAHAVDERRTAGAFSLLASAQMFGACCGPFLSGPLAVWLGVRPLFLISGVLLFGGALAAFRVRSLRPAAGVLA